MKRTLGLMLAITLLVTAFSVAFADGPKHPSQGGFDLGAYDADRNPANGIATGSLPAAVQTRIQKAANALPVARLVVRYTLLPGDINDYPYLISFNLDTLFDTQGNPVVQYWEIGSRGSAPLYVTFRGYVFRSDTGYAFYDAKIWPTRDIFFAHVSSVTPPLP